MNKPSHDPFTDILALPVDKRGAWIATSLGGMWSIEHPAPGDVRIEDVAAGLSRNCRYNGQLKEDADFLSVAEHSVAMTKWAVANGVATHREDALAILLHDASEAFYGDMVTPLKDLLPQFRKYEDKAQAVIMTAFGLAPDAVSIRKEEIKLIDRRIRLDERDAVIEDPARSIGKRISWDKEPDLASIDVEIAGLNPRAARQAFLECFTWIVEALPLRNPALARLHDGFAAAARRNLERMTSRESIPCMLDM
ncbi:hypothetical protein [Defluviimonas salinarum]|uniref:HD domain-containing protein n=1 Tax=Defluviimonas salinarum TaxID=2992147 RepID=A0ABT3J473_9RHOB|nr:hypothetical protein [Defluviimonas salinarum]MCW3782496.1 hypothetical protein [Defluviimonas salinarum]